MSRAFVVLVAAGAVGWSGSVSLGVPAISVYDIADTDVPGPQPIRAFPVPAAAGWTGAAYLIYDNYAEGLGFSAGIVYPDDLNWMQTPMGNASVAIHGVTHDYQYNVDPTSIAIQDETDYFTNIEGSDTEAPEGTPPPA